MQRQRVIHRFRRLVECGRVSELQGARLRPLRASDSSGGFSKTTLAQLAASNSRYQAATQTCGHLLSNGGSGSTQAYVRQEWSGMLNFARCMHSHGVPNWPDPTPYPPYPNEPTFVVPASIQPIPQIISKMDECLRLVPNNHVVGHIDNNSWHAAQQAMAGS